MLRAGQFTLKSLLVATALIALACEAARLSAVTHDPYYAATAVPFLLFGAVGVLRGRFIQWVLYAVAVDWALFVLVLLGWRLGLLG